MGPSAFMLHEKWFDKEIEHSLERIVKNFDSFLITCGQPEDKGTGAGRIKFHESIDWHESVYQLIQDSKHIFIVPWVTEGMKWEIDLIFSDQKFLNKTIFIMPPTIKDNNDEIFKIVEKYDEIRDLFKLHSVDLQDYSRKGFCFIIPDGKPIYINFSSNLNLDDDASIDNNASIDEVFKALIMIEQLQYIPKSTEHQVKQNLTVHQEQMKILRFLLK
jgi:hypothetical protein